jgi:Protein of unknown function (DUF1566)
MKTKLAFFIVALLATANVQAQNPINKLSDFLNKATKGIAPITDDKASTSTGSAPTAPTPPPAPTPVATAPVMPEGNPAPAAAIPPADTANAKAKTVDAEYSYSSDGREVIDTKNGLIWRRCPEGMNFKGGTCTGTASKYTFDSAIDHAAKQARASKTDWRVPITKELLTLVKERSLKTDVVFDKKVFPETPEAIFWSSVRTKLSDYVYGVNFYAGSWYDVYHNQEHYLRLVRSAK